MKKFKLTGIDWDCDDDSVQLPEEMVVECLDEDSAVDAASDKTGWCINSVKDIVEIKNYILHFEIIKGVQEEAGADKEDILDAAAQSLIENIMEDGIREYINWATSREMYVEPVKEPANEEEANNQQDMVNETMKAIITKLDNLKPEIERLQRYYINVEKNKEHWEASKDHLNAISECSYILNKYTD